MNAWLLDSELSACISVRYVQDYNGPSQNLYQCSHDLFNIFTVTIMSLVCMRVGHTKVYLVDFSVVFNTLNCTCTYAIKFKSALQNKSEKTVTIQHKMVVRENFCEFGESEEIHQRFIHPNLYHKTAGRQNIHHDE